MRPLPFDALKVPYSYETEIAGKRVRLTFLWNHMGGYISLRVEHPETREVLWTRPLHYGADAFYGITLKGLEGAAVVPWVAELGVRGNQALVTGGRATVALLEGVWKGHEPKPWEMP